MHDTHYGRTSAVTTRLAWFWLLCYVFLMFRGSRHPTRPACDWACWPELSNAKMFRFDAGLTEGCDDHLL